MLPRCLLYSSIFSSFLLMSDLVRNCLFHFPQCLQAKEKNTLCGGFLEIKPCFSLQNKYLSVCEPKEDVSSVPDPKFKVTRLLAFGSVENIVISVVGFEINLAWFIVSVHAVVAQSALRLVCSMVHMLVCNLWVRPNQQRGLRFCHFLGRELWRSSQQRLRYQHLMNVHL